MTIMTDEIGELSDQNVFTLFSRQSEIFSDKVAVIDDHESVSYRELAARAEAIGNHLAQRVAHEQAIGVFTSRSVDMIAAMLGIWKAGCAYVPLDPNDPPERTRRILEIADCEVVLARQQRHAGDRGRPSDLKPHRRVAINSIANRGQQPGLRDVYIWQQR